MGRQYTGTAGWMENAIVVVCSIYAAAHGHALADRDQALRVLDARREPAWAPATRA